MNKKNIIIVVSLLFSLFLIWYLFIKKSDFLINFKTKASTGVVYQGINEWQKAQAKLTGESYKLLEKNKFDFLKFETSNGNKTLIYEWEIKPINDSVSGIQVGIKEPGKSIYNRLTAPFFNTNFKTEQVKKITDFKTVITEHLSSYKLKSVSEGSTNEVFVACINLKSVLQEKAQNMIMNDATITGYLSRNNIKILGKPYLEVTNWDIDNEMLDFNYCFPIDKSTKYIADKYVSFKTIPAKKGLKISYFGNFRTSDRGWFAIMDYAKKKGQTLDLKPLEHFLANPFNGGDEISWETQIIIPFKK
jgi:effector-binding domain-containing protein